MASYEGHITARRGLTIKVSAETQVDLFEELTSVVEVFGQHTCGLCGGEDIYPQKRKVKPAKKPPVDYHEWRCRSCGATLSLSKNIEGGGLYPVRKLTAEGLPATGDKEGTYGKHNGWYRFKDAKTSSEGDF